MKQRNRYLQFCRSETNCQGRIHCLLEAAGLTFELIIICNAQNSVFYNGYLVTKRPILATACLVCFIGHNMPCLFYWPQHALFLLLIAKWPRFAKWPCWT